MGKEVKEVLKRGTFVAMHLRMEPIKKVANMLRCHEVLILNWFSTKNRLSNEVVEGFNWKAKLTIKKSYGFKSFKVAQLALYHVREDLLETEATPTFT